MSAFEFRLHTPVMDAWLKRSETWFSPALKPLLSILFAEQEYAEQMKPDWQRAVLTQQEPKWWHKG